MLNLTWHCVESLASNLYHNFPFRTIHLGGRKGWRVYGIPNGGVYVALMLQRVAPDMIELTETPDGADVFVDDIIDSGATRAHYQKRFPNIPFLALLSKEDGDKKEWVSFPWERMGHKAGPQENIVRILQYLGEDPEREGLKETPDRVVRSYDELFSGYKQKPEDVFKTFEDSCDYDEMIVCRGVEFTSFCEHHMLPFIGKGHIAYIPKGGKIIGLSKLARLLEIYSRRLQVQEKLTRQVTMALDEHLKPLGSACILEAKHLCMCARGVGKQHSDMVTSSLTGAFRQPEVRAELFNLIQG